MKKSGFMFLVLIFMSGVFAPPFSFAEKWSGNRGYVTARSRKARKEKKARERAAEMKRVIEIGPYVIGPKDVIDINVVLHPELSGKFVVQYNGAISLPLTGEEVFVSGMTTSQVRAKLKTIISEYIEEPMMTVKVAGYNSRVVYVLGEVGNQGPVPITDNILTLRDAVFAAGIPNGNAALRRVLVITPSYVGKPKVKRVDLYRILYEGDLRDNIVLNPGDVVYVPMTLFSKVGRTFGQLIAPLSPLYYIQTYAGGAVGTGI